MRDRVTCAIVFVLLNLVGASPTPAEDEAGSRPAVGDEAPPITATTWLNTEEGANPTKDADEKVILVELWGTWCGPCVRSMPKLQALWERLQDRGLLVVAVTREPADKVRGFLEENGYTMPVACDPTEACVKRYLPSGWPSTYLIGRNGEIAYVGGPYSVEAAVEKALGLESSPATLLTQYLDALGKGDKGTVRETMERLLEKAPPAFDAKAWAESTLGDAPEVEGKPKKVKALKVLDQIAKARKAKKEDECKARLTELASGESDAVDLRAWIAAAYAKAYPLTRKELAPLLEGKRYETVLGMLLDRGPSKSVLKTAAKDDGLQSYCSRKTDDTRKLARKGLMAHTYLFGDKRYAPEKNDAFWKDIAVSGMATSKDKKRMVGVLLGGEMVSTDRAESYVSRKLSLWALMRELAAGDAPSAKAVQREAAKERKRILRELAGRYE